MHVTSMRKWWKTLVEGVDIKNIHSKICDVPKKTSVLLCSLPIKLRTERLQGQKSNHSRLSEYFGKINIGGSC